VGSRRDFELISSKAWPSKRDSDIQLTFCPCVETYEIWFLESNLRETQVKTPRAHIAHGVVLPITHARQRSYCCCLKVRQDLSKLSVELKKNGD
jgi:hypothetical protein